MVSYTIEQVQRMNRTAQVSQRWTSRAIVPKIVAAIAVPKASVLDYGAGPRALHTRMLRRLGLRVTAYDIGKNGSFNKALATTYDLVFASNVLNIQPSYQHVQEVLDEMTQCVRPDGILVCNLPEHPRHAPVNAAHVDRMLRQRFTYVTEVRPYVWIAKRRW